MIKRAGPKILPAFGKFGPKGPFCSLTLEPWDACPGIDIIGNGSILDSIINSLLD